MLEGTGVVPWILASIGAVFVGILVVIIVKCVRGMKKFKEDDKSPIVSLRAEVDEKIRVQAKKRTPSFIPSEKEGDKISVTLIIDGKTKEYDVAYNVFTELRSGMTGMAQFKAGKLVGFICDDGRTFGNEHNMPEG